MRLVSLGAVYALVGELPHRPDLVDETRAALAGQTDPLTSVAVHPLGDTAARVRAALKAGADWLWLLDGVTVPEPGALTAFAAALDSLTGLAEPLVLTSKVLATTGTLHPDAIPRHEIFEREYTVAAAERGLVQLRAAPSGSLLVRREAFERFGALRTDLSLSWQAFEFTARVLRSREDTGYLVPASVAVRAVPPRSAGRRGGAIRARAGLLAGPVWKPRERMWEGFLVAEGALKDARERARRA